MAFKINVELEFDDCEINEILSVALGTEAYDWILRVETVGECDSIGDYLMNGGSLTIVDSEGNAHELNKEKMIKGIECYCKRLFAMDSYNLGVRYSVDFSDSILQCALFGEVLYG